jgi:hypothetical protein
MDTIKQFPTLLQEKPIKDQEKQDKCILSSHTAQFSADDGAESSEGALSTVRDEAP